MYESRFNSSESVENLLREGKIIDAKESASQMIERMVETIFEPEASFGYSASETDSAKEEFGVLCDNRTIVMSTPVMTNAGRYPEKPLTACTMPPVELRQHLKGVQNMIDTLHQQGMGTGFNLNEVSEPVKTLRYLNKIAVQGAERGNEDRPVGNMAILSVRHPKIRDFIEAKRQAGSDGSVWKFNVSVDIDDEFMMRLSSQETLTLLDGTLVDAEELFAQISSAAHQSADPGLVFMDRMNKRNPTPAIGLYQTTAPCAEVGLAPGETCQFGYINVGELLKVEDGEQILDEDKLIHATRILTRALDNCLELSINRYTTPKSRGIMELKRKIGVGICGVADYLVKKGIPYDSSEAVEEVQAVASLINYQSKLASVELAQRRGSCGAMQSINVGPSIPTNRHLTNPSILEELFSEHDTSYVTGDMWRDLAQGIRSTLFLRNVSTTALPPTGRSSLIIGASAGIEPLFSMVDDKGEPKAVVKSYLEEKSIQSRRFLEVRNNRNNASPEEEHALEVCKSATEISPTGHIAMASGVQLLVDEAVSKTINIPASSSAEDVFQIYQLAWQKGMSGITIYRAGTHEQQPVELEYE